MLFLLNGFLTEQRVAWDTMTSETKESKEKDRTGQGEHEHEYITTGHFQKMYLREASILFQGRRAWGDPPSGYAPYDANPTPHACLLRTPPIRTTSLRTAFYRVESRGSGRNTFAHPSRYPQQRPDPKTRYAKGLSRMPVICRSFMSPKNRNFKNWDRRENGNWALIEGMLSVMIGVVEHTASSGTLFFWDGSTQ